MRIRLGYVAITNTLDITSSKTLTYTNYQKLEDAGNRIDSVIRDNLTNLIEILKYNVKNNIHFYRITSKLIPLATKDDVKFDYIKPYKKYYDEIAYLINFNGIRVDFHPDQFVVLNSTNKIVVQKSIDILEYHYKLLEAMNVKDKLLVLHVGSNTFGKKNSLTRFINSFNKLPSYLKKCIALENDDKIFTIDDVLYLCERLSIPCILDYHHHICNYINYDIRLYLDRILNTWTNTPKMHFSSPKSKLKREFRSHSDYINGDDFISFLEVLKHYKRDIDIMLEVKSHDDALFRLIRYIKYKTTYMFDDDTTFNTN